MGVTSEERVRDRREARLRCVRQTEGGGGHGGQRPRHSCPLAGRIPMGCSLGAAELRAVGRLKANVGKLLPRCGLGTTAEAVHRVVSALQWRGTRRADAHCPLGGHVEVPQAASHSRWEVTQVAFGVSSGDGTLRWPALNTTIPCFSHLGLVDSQ